MNSYWSEKKKIYRSSNSSRRLQTVRLTLMQRECQCLSRTRISCRICSRTQYFSQSGSNCTHTCLWTSVFKNFLPPTCAASYRCVRCPTLGCAACCRSAPPHFCGRSLRPLHFRCGLFSYLIFLFLAFSRPL